jgi:hypothetical protein
MAIRFNGLVLSGKVLEGYDPEAPDQRATYDAFPGVHGEVKTLHGLGGRNILIPMIVFDRTLRTYAAAYTTYQLLAQRAGEPTQGRLDIELAYGAFESYINCSFVGFRRLSSIKPDFAGGLVPDTLTYFFMVLLHFRQHAYE